MTDPGTVVRARALTKTYARGDEQVHALREVGLSLHPGELVALVGPSGSGKSTLLNVLCGWERADSGTLEWTAELALQPPDRLPWGRLAIVPQALGLLEDLTIGENILLPARLTGRLRELQPRAAELMDAVGIGHLSVRYPRQTSLGEQQRLSFACAVIGRPAIVVADEPTAELDSASADRVLEAVHDLRDEGVAFLLSSHDPRVVESADHLLRLEHGRVVESW